MLPEKSVPLEAYLTLMEATLPFLVQVMFWLVPATRLAASAVSVAESRLNTPLTLNESDSSVMAVFSSPLVASAIHSGNGEP